MTKRNTTINWLLSLALLTTGSMLAAQQDEDAERAKLRQEIQQARTEMAEAARRMARLQRQLGARATGLEIVRHRADGSANEDEDVSIRFEDSEGLALTGMPPRLGVLLGGPGADANNEIIGLTPGGGAEAAGIQQGDRLISVNEKKVTEGAPGSVREALEGVEAGSTVEVIVERDGERLAFNVETTSVVHDVRVFGLRSAPKAGEFEREIVILRRDGANLGHTAMSPKPPFPPRAPLFSVLGSDSDLISNHAGLEPYFGTANGVVVLRIDPENHFDLRDGDVVLRLDDETINRPIDLGRLLLGRDAGEQVVFEIMREGVLTQIQTTIPEDSESIGALPMRFEIKSAPKPPIAQRPPLPL